jgi:hypothetical protein
MTKPAFDYSTYDFMITAKAAADLVGSKVSWNEAGSASCGGLEGISDAFGAALWAVDASFSMAYLQVDDVLFNGLPQALYGPLRFDPKSGWTVGSTCL